MELMKENQPPVVNAGWNNNGPAGLDLLVKAAQKSSQPKKSKGPTMVLNGSYDTPVIVGRGSQATLNLGRVNKQVSRRHAIIQWCAESAAFEITVLGQNGVRINGTGFPSGQQATLRGGDIVDLVGVKMLFKTPTTAPPLALTLQEYQDDDSSQDAGLENFNEEDQVYEDSNGIGLVTPKRPQHSTLTHNQLATPGTSSPAPRDLLSSPSQSTPTARMRHKMLKYDLSSSPNRNNNVYQTPPSATSDARTEYSSSPVKRPPVFAIPFDALPNRSSDASLPVSPSSEPNFFMDDTAASSPFTVPNQQQRAPLAPLALTENSSVKVAKSSSQESTQRTASVSGSPLSKSSKNNVNANTIVKPAVTKAGATTQKSASSLKDIENVAPTTKDSAQKASKPKDKENHSAKSEIKTKTPTSTTVTAQPPKGKDAVAKSTTSTTTAVKAPKPKTAPKEKAVVVKESAAATKQETVSSSRESSTDAPATSKSASDKEPRDYTEMIIDTLVFARKKKSMTLTELFDEMITSQPSLMATHDAEEIKEQMLQCLSAARCVGKITRKGKDAYNKPLENQWYYIPECDHNVMRKLTRQEVMPSARKCTLKDKQYFFKMPPKLPYHRKSTSPYAVKPSARRAKEPSKLSAADNDDGSNGDVSSSSSSSDAEDDVDDQPLSATLNRKRKSTVAGHVDKKRKASSAAPTTTTTTAGGPKPTAGNDDEEEEDEDDDDAHNDSLDDLSELSGLSD
ncbi:hypothetical protein K457DRAFT_20426 [Linnemannia elongata AG-77]|uniref:FHA domain-containing protein n=1 Tax=Linnemannia elongata AG-77 TaxID=1314771 RepID=A0A197JTE3_9FUNG|nr:hypothetical protein K457DRAFT_20426 [Linnemannia elongata AG-77]